MNQILSMNDGPDKNQGNNIKVQNNQINTSQLNQGFAPYQTNYNPTQVQPAPVYDTNYYETIKRANETSNKADILKVIKIFCIVIIIFGVSLIGESTYAMISKRKKVEDNPKVYPVQMGKETKITVETEHPIKEFLYKWNEGEPVIIQGNGTVLFETVIQIPNGNNILNMTITDYNGNKQNFQRQYIYDSTDAIKPTIEIAISGTKLRINASDDIEMSYITYSWNDEEATRVEVEDDDKTSINVDIDVPEGQNELTIIAVDGQGNRETRTESVIGDTKPSFEMFQDGQNVIVKAEDDKGISRITMDIDGQITDSGEDPINLKEVTASSPPIESGTHTITVTVTNVNGLSDTKTITVDF